MGPTPILLSRICKTRELLFCLSLISIVRIDETMYVKMLPKLIISPSSHSKL